MNKFEELQFKYSDKYFKDLLQIGGLLYKKENNPDITITSDEKNEYYITISWYFNEGTSVKSDVSFEFEYNQNTKEIVINDIYLFNYIEEEHILFTCRHKFLYNHKQALIKLLNYWLPFTIKSLNFYKENE